MMESISHLSSALEFGLNFIKLAVIDCLAITTYFGTKDLDEVTLGINVVDEIEMVMGIIWGVLPSLSKSSEERVFDSDLAKALSAWSLLLSNIAGWRISLHMWKESLSILSFLLQNDDCWVRIAAAEAVAVIFETGRVERFSQSNEEFDEIISIIRRVVYEEKEKVNEDINQMQQSFKRVLEFIETGKFLKMSIRMYDKEEPLKVSTFAQYLQLKYLKHFLGKNGFFNHLKDNKKIHALLGYEEEEEEEEDEFCAEEYKMKIMNLMQEVKFMGPKLKKTRTQLTNMSRACIKVRPIDFVHYSDEEC
ncbi:Uncharacterized protein M6B38_239675 [Iris pallida]|uniref:Interferon-related developmental regulator N-terminal domain-containing protein n=1 Tax=Iris pallida TaxID=29817 RepID=A0AAX6DL22_IRIPA|nr:Uncharacterized protein M6B38_239675 [Iris pallida]